MLPLLVSMGNGTHPVDGRRHQSLGEDLFLCPCSLNSLAGVTHNLCSDTQLVQWKRQLTQSFFFLLLHRALSIAQGDLLRNAHLCIQTGVQCTIYSCQELNYLHKTVCFLVGTSCSKMLSQQRFERKLTDNWLISFFQRNIVRVNVLNQNTSKLFLSQSKRKHHPQGCPWVNPMIRRQVKLVP